MLATKEQLTSSLRPTKRADARRRHPTSFAPRTFHKKDAEGYRLRTSGQGRRRIEIQAFGGIFQFPQVLDMLREQWKKISIQADLGDALWRGEAMTLQVSFPLEHSAPTGWDVFVAPLLA